MIVKELLLFIRRKGECGKERDFTQIPLLILLIRAERRIFRLNLPTGQNSKRERFLMHE